MLTMYALVLSSPPLPSSPNNFLLSRALVRYRDLPDRSRSFVVFVSHAWMRPHTTPSFAHPDTSSRGGEKYRLIAEAGDRIRAHLPPDVRVLLWIDYACVDQVRKDETYRVCLLNCISPRNPRALTYKCFNATRMGPHYGGSVGGGGVLLICFLVVAFRRDA